MRNTRPGVCYVLFCFRSLEFVAFLLSALFCRDDIFLVHCDPKAPRNLKLYVDSLSARYENIVRLEPEDYSWAGYSHVRISLRAISAAFQIPISWTHLVFLSEQHLPLKDPHTIAAQLQGRGSLVKLARAADMLGAERADIMNRFAARYRELPGVGSFAVDLADRAEEYIEHIYHGSNWMTLCREHCQLLVNTEKSGRLRAFEDTVHAEETAIQTIIAPHMKAEDCIDLTLVAWPHLTDNHDLEASEELVKSAIGTQFAFIRKRRGELSQSVREFVQDNNFCEDIYRIKDRGTEACDSHAAELLAAYYGEFRSYFGRHYVEMATIQCVGEGPVFHVAIRTGTARANRSVRVLSANLTDFKVCIIEDIGPIKAFPAPFILNRVLYSTARTKVYGVFGQRDILPLDIPGRGFISIDQERSIGPVAELAAQFLRAAAAIS